MKPRISTGYCRAKRHDGMNAYGLCHRLREIRIVEMMMEGRRRRLVVLKVEVEVERYEGV